MNNLTQKYMKTHCTGLDCRMTNLRNILHFYGIPQSYATVFGMSSALDFGYRTGRGLRDHIEFPDFDPTRFFRPITGHRADCARQLAQNFGGHLLGNYPDTLESSQDSIRDYLHRGMPVMLAVSRLVVSQFLGRADGFPDFLQGIQFGGHWVVITEINDAAKTATIFETDMLRPIEIPLSILDHARTAGDDHEMCLMKSRCRWMLFVPPSTLPPYSYTLRTAITRMLVQMMYSESEPHVHRGLRGLQRLAADLPAWRNDPDMQSYKLPASVFILYLNGEVLSSAMGRRLYATFLRQAAVREKSDTLQNAADEFSEAASAWRNLIAGMETCVNTREFSYLEDNQTRATLDLIISHETTALQHVARFLNKGN